MNFSDDEASATRFGATHAVDIFAFVDAREIPSSCFETPYYLAPAPGGEKVYAQLREALNRTNKVGIARVVIQSRRHLAALIPCGPVLMLNTLRAAGASPSPGLPAERIRTQRLTEQEIATATEVVESMTTRWGEGWSSQRCTDFMVGEAAALTERGSGDSWLEPQSESDLLAGFIIGNEDDELELAHILQENSGLSGDGTVSSESAALKSQANRRPRNRFRRTLH